MSAFRAEARVHARSEHVEVVIPLSLAHAPFARVLVGFVVVFAKRGDQRFSVELERRRGAIGERRDERRRVVVAAGAARRARGPERNRGGLRSWRSRRGGRAQSLGPVSRPCAAAEAAGTSRSSGFSRAGPASAASSAGSVARPRPAGAGRACRSTSTWTRRRAEPRGERRPSACAARPGRRARAAASEGPPECRARALGWASASRDRRGADGSAGVRGLERPGRRKPTAASESARVEATRAMRDAPSAATSCRRARARTAGRDMSAPFGLERQRAPHFSRSSRDSFISPDAAR